MRVRMPLLVLVLSLFPTLAFAQTVTVRRNVNLRPDPSTEYDAIRLLKPGEPPLTLLDPSPEFGYYHVKTAAGEEGFVWSRNVRVVASENVPADTVHLGPGVLARAAWSAAARASGSTSTTRPGCSYYRTASP